LSTASIISAEMMGALGAAEALVHDACRARRGRADDVVGGAATDPLDLAVVVVKRHVRAGHVGQVRGDVVRRHHPPVRAACRAGGRNAMSSMSPSSFSSTAQMRPSKSLLVTSLYLPVSPPSSPESAQGIVPGVADL